jgi:predicted acylesterase/phospholipase RssA
MARPFRILSLSGGGVRGIFQATFLRCLEQSLGGGTLTSRFDLAVGTSTGGIMALAVAAGVDPARIRTLYEEHADSIFRSKFAAGIRRGPRYDAGKLHLELTTVFGDTRLAELSIPVVVTASALDRFTGRLISSAEDPDMSLVDAALATSSAPTFFAPVTPAVGSRSYVDGGIWANDPVLVSVLHAHHALGVPLRDLRVLAVGTGAQPSGMTAAEVEHLRILSSGTAHYVLELLMGSQSWFSEHFARGFLREHQLVIVNPRLPHSIPLDDVKQSVAQLPGLAEGQFADVRPAVTRLLSDDGSGDPLPPAPVPEHIAQPIRESNITALYASRRDYERFRPGYGTIDTYVGKATESLVMISLNLMTGVAISGVLERFREMIVERDQPVSITVSLIDPREDHLMKTLAPVLDIEQIDLSQRVAANLTRLCQFRASLPRKSRPLFSPRTHKGLPPASAILIDHELPEGTIQLETKPFQAAMQESFAIEVGQGSALYTTLVGSYEKVLKTGAEVREWTWVPDTAGGE